MNQGRSDRYFEMVDAPSPDDYRETVRFGIRQEVILRLVAYQRKTAVAQFLGVVSPGLILARHAFRGLRRPLYHDGDFRADRTVVAYTWRPSSDFVWVGDPHYGHPEAKVPPARTVFVVLVREVADRTIGDVRGSIEHWNWIREAEDLPHAPTQWKERYGLRLWSRTI